MTFVDGPLYNNLTHYLYDRVLLIRFAIMQDWQGMHKYHGSTIWISIALRDLCHCNCLHGSMAMD